MLAIRRWKRKFQAADELKYRLRSTMCQAPARHAHCPVVTSIFRAVTGPQPSSSTPTESFSAKNALTALDSRNTQSCEIGILPRVLGIGGAGSQVARLSRDDEVCRG